MCDVMNGEKRERGEREERERERREKREERERERERESSVGGKEDWCLWRRGFHPTLHAVTLLLELSLSQRGPRGISFSSVKTACSQWSFKRNTNVYTHTFTTSKHRPACRQTHTHTLTNTHVYLAM